MIAHELRNLLTPLVSCMQVLRQGETSSEEQAALLKIIGDQLPHVLRLVDELAGDAPQPDYETLDLREIVRERAALCRAQAREATLAFSLDLPAVPVLVRGDASRLHQVFVNLLSNAMRYTPRGGRIAVELSSSNGHASVRITDTGAGLLPEQRKSIFEPYVRVHANIPGQGLGLAMVQSVVAMHGGRVYAESSGLGAGSTFTVELPTVKDGGPPAEPLLCHRILLVEDNVVAALALTMLLRSWEQTVETVLDPGEAVQRAQEFHPSVVILDIGLPGRDGHDLLAELRKQVSGKLIVIGLSGSRRDRKAEQERGVFFDYYLTKPPDPDELLRILNEACG